MVRVLYTLTLSGAAGGSWACPMQRRSLITESSKAREVARAAICVIQCSHAERKEQPSNHPFMGAAALVIGAIGSILFRDLTLIGARAAMFAVTLVTMRGWLKG